MRVSVANEQDRVVIALEGDIDEEIDQLAKVLAQIQGQRWVFDCAGVRRINSMGSSKWISILSGIPQDVSYSFRRCPMAFVDMVVMVPMFVHGRKIESFFVPYHCTDCNNETHYLLSVEGGGDVPASLRCDKCNEAMVPDEDVYDDLEALSTLGVA